jgi:poly(A) polymerase/tRNA nucleotidyltransferase (CCA-adding enzyme)
MTAVKEIRAAVAANARRADTEEPRERAAARLASHPWPEELLRVLERLRQGGHQALLVGGTVRDALLRRPPHSTFDVATDLLPLEVSGRFERVEPIGLKHGTVLIVAGDLLVECTTFRREGEYQDARHPDSVEFTRDPIEDLARRDLTVNAMAYDPESKELLDPHGGALDLERGILRAVGDPVLRFREDALRPLRVARLAAVLEMEPEEKTRASLGAVIDRAKLVAWERVSDELRKMMSAPRPSIGFELLREAGLLELWLPELQRCYGVLQNRYHAYDVYDHSLHTCDEAPRDKPLVRWAALLHDVGKPDTRVERHGEGTFYNHQFVGAEITERVLERLRFPLEERRAIVHLVREHMFDYQSEWSDGALRRWLARVGIDYVADLFDLRIADYLGNGLRQGLPGYLEEMRERIESLLRQAQVLRVKDLAVDGKDVMAALGIDPGPEVGAALDALLEEVLERPEANQRQHLLQRLAQWRRERV